MTENRKAGKSMSQKLIITNLSYQKKEYIFSALYEDRRLVEVSAQPTENPGILGNIYVGRVKDIVKNLNAAFIEIAPGLPCYYPLDELVNPIFVKKINSPRLVQGDELYVQVEREAMKTKPPKVTTNLNFTGKYLVLTTGIHTLGISKKLDNETRVRLKSLIAPVKPEDFGVILRTESRDASREQLWEELNTLTAQARAYREKAAYQTCFSCIERQEPEFLSNLKNLCFRELEGIVTDDLELYRQLENYLEKHQPMDRSKLSYYKDELLSLSKCFSLEKKVQDALSERVWLKSGGYLVIEPTEALTVIDVNSGKSRAKKNVQEHYAQINREAAWEIAVQLRLRNISGIILIDFIDMTAPKDQDQLMEELRRAVQKDPTPVQVVDRTKLNLVELTRKKRKKSLREQLS